MTDTKYTPTELEQAITSVKQATHTDSMMPYIWARNAVVLCAALEAAQAELAEAEANHDNWLSTVDEEHEEELADLRKQLKYALGDDVNAVLRERNLFKARLAEARADRDKAIEICNDRADEIVQMQDDVERLDAENNNMREYLLEHNVWVAT